ncbi:hypothetical protein B0H19DRAFT_1273314 [Mycena capillaripes]|nr:hypothetical protein B0H19DRAFT_1273314 [Mycena capillaripes]
MEFSLKARNRPQRADDEHLSNSWVIALVISLLALLALLIGTVIWHSRRKRRRQRARLLDAEGSGETRPPPDFSQDASISKPRPAATK